MKTRHAILLACALALGTPLVSTIEAAEPPATTTVKLAVGAAYPPLPYSPNELGAHFGLTVLTIERDGNAATVTIQGEVTLTAEQKAEMRDLIMLGKDPPGE